MTNRESEQLRLPFELKEAEARQAVGAAVISLNEHRRQQLIVRTTKLDDAIANRASHLLEVLKL